MPQPARSANSARPGSLKSPVPGKTVEPSDEELLASISAPTAMAAPAPSGTPAPTAELSDEELLASVAAPEGGTDVIPEDEMGDNPGFLESNFTPSGIARQLEQTPTRLRASFATTDKELRQVLEDKYGKENVKHTGDTFRVRRPGEKKFTGFNRGAWELVNDVADFAREGVEEAVTYPAEVFGAVKGGAIGAAQAAPTGPYGAAVGAGVGAVAGIAAGRAVGAGVATNVADLVAEHLLNIERDPERSRVTETVLSGTLSSAFGMLGDKLGAVAAKKIAAKKLMVSEHEAIATSSREVLDETRGLRDLGKISVGPDGKVALMPHQVDTQSWKARQWARLVSKLPAFQKLVNDQAVAADKVITDTLHEATMLTGKGPLNSAQIAKQVVNISKEIRQAEGAAVGEFRRKASAKLGDKAKTLPAEALGTMHELMGRMGFTPKDLKSAKPTSDVLDIIQGTMNIGSPGEARFLFNKMQQAANRLQNNKGMSFDDLAETITILDKGNKQARKAGGEVSMLYNRLSSQLRETRNKLVMDNLPPSEIPAFEKSMSRFRDVMEAQDNLGATLTEDIANHAFVNQVFSEAGGGLAKLRSVKTLLEESHPKVWNTIKANYVDQLIAKNTKKVSDYEGVLNAADIRQQVLKMGEEGREILFDGDAGKMKNFFSALDYGQRIRDTSFTSVAPAQLKDQAASFIGAAANGIYMKSKAGLALIGAADGAPSQFMEMITDEGVDKFFGKVPKGMQADARKWLSGMQDAYREAVRAGANPRSKAPVRRTMRSTLRDKSRESFAPGTEEESE